MNHPKLRAVTAASLILLAAACGQTKTAKAAKMLPFKVIEGVQSLTVVGADAGAPFTLYAADGRKMVTYITDQYGQASFAYIPKDHVTLQTGNGTTAPFEGGGTLQPGKGYVIKREDVSPVQATGPLRVLGIDDHPADLFYDAQRIWKGHNYIKARDGIMLSATVWFPDPVICGDAPYPTVVEYSGYGPANPDSQQPGTKIATLLLCFAAVGVDMRGSGCSGGVFDVFNTAQHADGYDAIEVVARQPWVLNHRVGMVGLSYPGISQLYVAYTNPPHLAAIAPQSVIEDPWRQAWPGGIYNSGFTRQWIKARDGYATAGGADWVDKRIKEGDTVCRDNMTLRNQNVNFEAFSKALSTFPPSANERRLGNLVHRINVPVFLTGAWQDEQTGSRFAAMLTEFTHAPVKKFSMFNGRHPDGYTPLMLSRWAEFLNFYVARKIPFLNPVFSFADKEILQSIFDAQDLHFERNRFLGYQDYEHALSAYEGEQPVRVLFESGFGSPVSEAPVARFERDFPAWPPPATPLILHLGPAGTLTTGAPAPLAVTDPGVDAYHHDPAAGDISYIRHDSLYKLGWIWEPSSPGYALGYLADPFTVDTLVVGNGGYAHLWFASDATDADVQVSILEDRPDGIEFLVENGVFAVKHRNGVNHARSSEFLVEYTYAEESMSYLTPGTFVEVDVPIQPFSHAFRAGSRLRVVIDTPGRNNGYWQYTNPAYGADVIHRIGRSPAMDSYVKLPTLTGTPIPNPAPPCGTLRGIVCRPFLPLPNNLVTP